MIGPRCGVLSCAVFPAAMWEIGRQLDEDGGQQEVTIVRRHSERQEMQGARLIDALHVAVAATQAQDAACSPAASFPVGCRVFRRSSGKTPVVLFDD
jgi:hypothetical protein